MLVLLLSEIVRKDGDHLLRVLLDLVPQLLGIAPSCIGSEVVICQFL